MDKVLLSGIFGACAGAMGFFLASRMHGKDKAEKRYPPYSLALFGLFHAAFYFLS